MWGNVSNDLTIVLGKFTVMSCPRLTIRHDRARAVASGHAVVGVEGVANALIEQPPSYHLSELSGQIRAAFGGGE